MLLRKQVLIFNKVNLMISIVYVKIYYFYISVIKNFIKKHN